MKQETIIKEGVSYCPMCDRPTKHDDLGQCMAAPGYGYKKTKRRAK